MFDLVIHGGSLVTSTNIQKKTIAIAGERVCALLDPGETYETHDAIDATGMLLLPGLVDAHVHFREPGLVHKEGFFTGSQAAAAGGVTTVMVMPTDNPMTTTPELFAEKIELGRKASHVDFALQAGLGPDTRHVGELVEMGAISFELFFAEQPPPMQVRSMHEFLGCLRAVRDQDSILGITVGDDSVTRALTQDLENNPGDWLGFARSRPPVVEAAGVAHACVAVAEIGTRAHVRQVSCAATADIVRRIAPMNLTAEVTPHNLLLDESELVRQGPVAKVSPPLRSKADMLAMQNAVREGTIHIVATDHAPHLPEEKALGNLDIWKAPRGLPGVQTFLPLMLRLVDEGVINYPDLVRLCCEIPARIFRLYPQKGTLLPGSDADVVIVDPEKPFVIRNEDQFSKSRLTPFDGWTASATAVLAMQRGRTIMRNGKPVGSPAGQFLRPSSSSIGP